MVTKTEPRMLTSDEVCNLAQISYRILDYWTRAGLFAPTQEEPGSGHHRIWPASEAAKAIEFAGMLRDGIAHERATELLREGQVGRIVSRELRDSIIDDLPPDSWDTE